MSNSNSIPQRVKNLTGLTFGRWTVHNYAGVDRGLHAWNCVCACGTERAVPGTYLLRDRTHSCGCLTVERTVERSTKHELVSTPEYNSWANMWQRCTNPNNSHYHLYKDRTPPPEWRSFEAFFADLGPRPSRGHTLDRVDNEKPYGPGNCRWALRAEQSRNTSRNVWVIQQDGQEVCLKDACANLDLTYTTFYSWLGKGQTIEEASNGLLKEAA